MPIPERLRPPEIDPDELQHYCKMLKRIERAIETHDDEKLPKLLKKWNARCQPRENHEFSSYWKSIDAEEFVGSALLPVATHVPDGTFAEVEAIVDCIQSAELDEALTSWCVEWLESNFPAANASDLIYWPDQWFGDSGNEKLLDFEFLPAQIVRYLCLASGRELPDTPTDIPLPHPLPERR